MSEDLSPERQFDQRHLIELFNRGLVNELPYELGPMPALPGDPEIGQDLASWNVIDSRGRLTREAAQLFAGITGYSWAISGTLLLYNERRDVQAKIPDEFLQYKLQYAIRDIPRVTFLIGVLSKTVEGVAEPVISSIVQARGRLVIGSDHYPGTEEGAYEKVAQIVSAIVDPKGVWKPYPLAETAIPAATATAVAADRNTDPEQVDEIVETTTNGLVEAGLSAPTVRTLTEMLRRDNVANVELALTKRTAIGKKMALYNAAGVLFFIGDTSGVADRKLLAVSYPTRAIDGQKWITYESANLDSMTRAIAAMHDGFGKADPAHLKNT